MHADRASPRGPVSGAEQHAGRQPVQLRPRAARADQPRGLQVPRRLQHHAARPGRTSASAIENEKAESARGLWWGASEVALPTPNYGKNNGRSVSGNVVSVLSPTMTNESLRQLEPPDARQHLQGSLEGSHRRYPQLAVSSRVLPATSSPYIPLLDPEMGRRRSNLWSPAMDLFAHNDALNFSEKVTKIAGAHGMKFGSSPTRLQKQQNFHNNEMGYMEFDPWATGGTGNARPTCSPAVSPPIARARRFLRAIPRCGTATSSRRTAGS